MYIFLQRVHLRLFRLFRTHVLPLRKAFPLLPVLPFRDPDGPLLFPALHTCHAQALIVPGSVGIRCVLCPDKKAFFHQLHRGAFAHHPAVGVRHPVHPHLPGRPAGRRYLFCHRPDLFPLHLPFSGPDALQVLLGPQSAQVIAP